MGFFIANEWKHVAKSSVFLHDEGYFVIKFSSKKERDDVLKAGPYTFYGRPMITKPWSSGFSFQDEILRVIPVWVRLPNLPLCCWGSDSLSRIGSLIGVPLFADDCTSKQLRISFARLLIEVDVTKELPKEVLIQDHLGVTIKQKVEYDWLPPFCKDCNAVGHDCRVKKNVGVRLQTATTGPTQQKTQKVWRPKKVVEKEIVVPTSEIIQELVIPSVIDKVVPVGDVYTPKTDTTVALDDGWRVVSRRRKEAKTPNIFLGLAQVHAAVAGISEEEGGSEGEGEEFPP
ncbi:uncharacterized protein [Spinacia oleracea]|uniref:DUF4283 domain-containing protein n=1 Tax=Spinacia oleracea TaxID=3562 RepID=A0ABM3RSS3_SPIOL|nr:uncharacterized protein LOC130472197 [Spinacia oleracea]